jgi:hypothetical protein
MGFNKRYINYQNTIIALQSNTLKDYYGKSDAFIFDDERSEKVYNLFVEGKTTDEILKLLNSEKILD